MTTLKPEDNATQWRSRLKAARAALTPAERNRAALLIRARLFAWLGNHRDAALSRIGQPGAPAVAGNIAVFWPMADEPDLRSLMAQWSEITGVTLALPVIVAPGQPLQFHRWRPDTPMAEGTYGIPVPAGQASVLPDVILVPTLGFTGRADRLGYGAGYYDRTLAALREQGHPVVTIGIAWACGEMDDTYRAADHDQPLDAILTEEGWTPHAPGTRPGPRTRSLYSVRL